MRNLDGVQPLAVHGDIHTKDRRFMTAYRIASRTPRDVTWVDPSRLTANDIGGSSAMNMAIDNVIDSNQLLKMCHDRFVGVGKGQVVMRQPYR